MSWDSLPEVQGGLAEFMRERGVEARSYLAALERLAQGPATTQELIDASALSRHGVEQLLRAAGAQAPPGGAGAWSLPSEAEAQRQALLGRSSEGPAETAVLDETVLDETVLDEIKDAQRRAPKANRHLDHVSATAQTALARARWLAERFWLGGARILFVGDHDLTSLAVARLCPGAEIAVVDVDEALVEFLAAELSARGAKFRARHADLRHRFPADLEGWADLFVTDPPYTPEGVALFCARGAQGLRSLARGRGVLAYGYGEDQPALGLAVQKAILGLDCLVEELVPDFNRYHGAQAIGSASDWHVLRFAPSAAKKIERAAREAPKTIYSHGRQSVESGGAAPASRDLRKQDASALFRALLWEGGERVELLVDNNHPDLRDAKSQARLSDDVAGKWSLRFRKSVPDSASAVVEAVAVERPNPRSLVLHRPHGKLKNVLREARILADPGMIRPVLTKNQAREFVCDALGSVPEWGSELGECLVGDAPRAALRALLRALEHAEPQSREEGPA
ncbi:bis-aminopropyl spermidine synthase family protein [Segniliparus rugosus]|uniref:N(4)-bis(aminopropyl)spermidine synthase C-terminal domain-containing protein n=1 Tax=Segniliparus rugosus (strain ATCC BAA-974 / DSM 45345 / CCUG 50838 / CIP 108380 / JCM 13579 / CDC 945) TaxID=679197 RepID=E5XPW2_SEGRC|nr:bis-aminopropyl spermidine synthase family protein [Segniliparus rugosus]EFV13613.1 hypothetical protein HMPREF9336_01534 [Segniliparus rugosus ATCC BAA-974]